MDFENEDFLFERANKDKEARRLAKDMDKPQRATPAKKAAKIHAQLKELFAEVKPYLNKQQIEYMKGVFEGTQPVDVDTDLEILIRQLQIVSFLGVRDIFSGQNSTKEFNDTINALRLSLRDLSDIRDRNLKREDKLAEKNSENTGVDFTRRKDIFQELNDRIDKINGKSK